jgi:hypothetical protein
MKLGVAGLLGDGSRDRIREVRRMGFAAASWHLPDLSMAEDRDTLIAVRDALQE